MKLSSLLLYMFSLFREVDLETEKYILLLLQHGGLCASVPGLQTLGIVEHGFNLGFWHLTLGCFIG